MTLQPVDVGSQRQLFIDHRFIENSDNIELHVNPPQRRGMVIGENHVYAHPHPHVCQDGRVVVFRSDRTGVPQIYAAHVADEFRESVITGELDQPNDKWM